MHKIKENKKILIILLLSIIGIVALVGGTYAIFFNEEYASNPSSYTTGTLSIVGTAGASLNLTDELPITDEEGITKEPYIFTITNEGNVPYKFNVKLLSTSSSTFSPQYIKVKVDDEEVKTLSALASSIVKNDVILMPGESVKISIKVWLSIDTPNTEIGKVFNSQIVTDGEAIYKLPETPISDFTYYLGSASTTLDTINYYDYSTSTTSSASLDAISLSTNEIIITQYNGSNKRVVIPSTYTIDNTTYNVTILSYAKITNNDTDTVTNTGIFLNNKIIENVTLDKNIKVISDYNTNGVTENDAYNLFAESSNLNNVSSIPNSITNLENAFLNCTNLTGIIQINSSEITNANNIFSGTTKGITLKVPNNSTTYTTINNLTTDTGLPSNVTLETY